MLSKVTPVALWGAMPLAKLFCTACLLSLFTSCYSVRVASTNSIPEPNIADNPSGYYDNKKFTVIDTVIRIKATTKDFTYNIPCSNAGLFSVEYKVSFGGLLLSTLTFGRHRKVKVTYVCVKEQN